MPSPTPLADHPTAPHPQLWAVEGNRQRLDGGAMFGHAPRALWQRWITPDEQHRIPLACRTMLVREPSGRVVLVETGIGCFFEPKLRDRYGVTEDEHVLLRSLAALGLTDADVDVVLLSHLHFDHAGGLLGPWRPDGEPELLFPNARFVVGADQLARALAPHARDKASYVPGLARRLEATGRLEAVTLSAEGLPGERPAARSETLGDAWHLHRSDGHTPGLMLPELATPAGPVVFAADLVPGAPWVHVPIHMGYDRWPERLVEEKGALLGDLESRGGWLFFTHDPTTALGRVARDARGRYHVADALAAPEAFGAVA